ncbi:MAG: hypothetical protein WC310_04295 [Patescibacteria group bacterium]|jgi:hypothetical protein
MKSEVIGASGDDDLRTKLDNFLATVEPQKIHSTNLASMTFPNTGGSILVMTIIYE